MKKVLLVLALAPCLAGCAVADLVAHTVKEVEKSQREPQAQSAQRSQPQPQAQKDEEPPPPVSAPISRRSSTVTVEELPPR
jgi:hypothetical protein